MIVLIGASASGKTELSKILCRSYNYQKCITTTTRPIRDTEKDGVDYHFISKEDFIKMNANNEFIGVTNYNNNYYGIQKKDLLLNGILIVDPIGANYLIDENIENIFIVFIETSEELRKLRMINRGDNQEIIEKRLVSDNELFQQKKIKRIDLLINNENNSLESLANEIHESYLKYLKGKNTL